MSRRSKIKTKKLVVIQKSTMGRFQCHGRPEAEGFQRKARFYAKKLYTLPKGVSASTAGNFQQWPAAQVFFCTRPSFYELTKKISEAQP